MPGRRLMYCRLTRACYSYHQGDGNTRVAQQCSRMKLLSVSVKQPFLVRAALGEGPSGNTETAFSHISRHYLWRAHLVLIAYISVHSRRNSLCWQLLLSLYTF